MGYGLKVGRGEVAGVVRGGGGWMVGGEKEWSVRKESRGEWEGNREKKLWGVVVDWVGTFRRLIHHRFLSVCRRGCRSPELWRSPWIRTINVQRLVPFVLPQSAANPRRNYAMQTPVESPPTGSARHHWSVIGGQTVVQFVPEDSLAERNSASTRIDPKVSPNQCSFIIPRFSVNRGKSHALSNRSRFHAECAEKSSRGITRLPIMSRLTQRHRDYQRVSPSESIPTGRLRSFNLCFD